MTEEKKKNLDLKNQNTTNISTEEQELQIKKEELTKAKAEATEAAKEATEASTAVSKVDARTIVEEKKKAVAKAAAKADADAKAKAKADAEAEEKVIIYIAAREEHQKKDTNKLIDATSKYDKFITDINKRLDHIIFLCNQFDFERINMLLKKLIVNHDYVAKNIIPNARKYSDLSSNKELNEKMLEKGGYTKMIVSMDKNFILINKKFTKFWEEYSVNIKTFHEESMSDDIKEINSKIAEILKKLKKLKYDDGKEQSTVPFDFSLIADNAIIYNFYNFFKKIIKKLHIIEGSIPDDANYEEFIAEQRREFDRKFYKMYESLYTDFKEKLSDSLEKIVIIKNRPKKNLSDIINILEQSVINNPENIAKAMSYVDDLYTEIPEEVVPEEIDDEASALLDKEKLTEKNLKTKTEHVEKLESDIKQKEVDLQDLKSKSTQDKKSAQDNEEKIIKLNEKLEILNKQEQNGALALGAELAAAFTDHIVRKKNLRLDLMGIPGAPDDRIIQSQKEWIISIQSQYGDNAEVKETLRYIMTAVRITDTTALAPKLQKPETPVPPDAVEAPSDATALAPIPIPVTPELPIPEAPKPVTPQPPEPEPEPSDAVEGAVVPVAQGAVVPPAPAAPANITKHFQYSFEDTSGNTKIYEDKGYIYKNGTDDGASFMASLNAGHKNLRVGGGTINGAFRKRIEPVILNTAQDTPFQDLSVKLHILCYMYYHYGKDVDKLKSKSAELVNMNITDNSTDGTKKQNIQSGFIKLVEDINLLPGDDNLLYKFSKLPSNNFIKEMYLYIPKERLNIALKFPTTCIIPGDIFIDILKDIPSLNGDTDTANKANRAMIYCTGPDGDNIKLNKPNATDSEIINIFLNAIEQVGNNIANAIFLYNKEPGKEKIDFVRICLISGNAYLPIEMKDKIESPDGDSYNLVPNREYQKQVAMKLIGGIHSANMVNNIQDDIVYNFAYAEKAFLNAYAEKEIYNKITPFILL